jgi:predicted phage tail protein
MKEVILNGFIGDKYGRHWNIKADRPHDVFSCIEANYPSFRKDMIEYIEAGGGIDVQCGDRFLEEEDLLFSIPEDSMIITPIPGGAKSGGSKLLLGALLLGSLFIPGSGIIFAAGAMKLGASVGTAFAIQSAAQLAIVGLGASLALAGITQMMAPDVKPEGREEKNYLFDGPENTVVQNNVVPVLMGEMIVGGVIIASGTASGLINRRSNTFIVSYPNSGTTSGGPNDGVNNINSIPGGGDNYREVDAAWV